MLTGSSLFLPRSSILSSVTPNRDIVVELASQDDCFLADIPHLVLEVNQDGRVLHKAHLLLCESSRGIWDTGEPLILPEVTEQFILSVSIQVDEHDRQLVGSIELSGTELYEIVGTQFGRRYSGDDFGNGWTNQRLKGR
ncbi:hypothetical protein CPB86DRAFT_830274 [Serendipita vermifera]|nr:hypothetical protein CPB86DRAFT_830274 [Serendipita vermifera]